MSWISYLFSFLLPQPLETAHSEINGNIQVQKYFGRNRIVAGKFTQSGEYIEDLLKKGVKKADLKSSSIKNILLLGVGGGSIIPEIRRLFPAASITGVEMDPEMVRLGKTYMHLKNLSSVQIVVGDAYYYVHTHANKLYDLIILDCYIGRDIPQKLESDQFRQDIGKLLTPHGVLICNRLFSGKYKQQTNNFVKKMKDIFPISKTCRIYSNLVVILQRK